MYLVLFNIFLFFTALTSQAAIRNYPADWWKPVPKEDAKSWEVLPQDAVKGIEVILSKRTELGIFSNFAATPILYRGKTYASIEGFWQSMKYPEGPNDPRAQFPGLKWEFTRVQVEQMTAFEAKEAGDKAGDNMKKMGIDWITFEGEKITYKGVGQQRHYEIILDITREKVRQHKQVKKLLKSTGNLVLLPDHKVDPNQPPAYRYYDIYMKIRSEI